jgi:hypothetical protein
MSVISDMTSSMFGSARTGRPPTFDPNQYKQYTTNALEGNDALQKQLEGQVAGGSTPIADQQFANALSKSQAAVASEVGGMKGLSPAAMAQLIAQGGATAAGTSAGQRALASAQERVANERLLGETQSAAINPTLSYQLGTQGNQLGTAQLGSQQTGAGLNLIGNMLTPMNQSAAGGLGGGGGGGSSSVAGADWSAGATDTAGGMSYMSPGGEIDGAAKEAGDSPDNDTVPAVLSPGEIVLPRTVAQAADAPERAAAFVAALKKNGGKPDKAGFSQILAAHKKLGEALKKWKGGEA